MDVFIPHWGNVQPQNATEKTFISELKWNIPPPSTQQDISWDFFYCSGLFVLSCWQSRDIRTKGPIEPRCFCTFMYLWVSQRRKEWACECKGEFIYRPAVHGTGASCSGNVKASTRLQWGSWACLLQTEMSHLQGSIMEENALRGPPFRQTNHLNTCSSSTYSLCETSEKNRASVDSQHIETCAVFLFVLLLLLLNC